MSSKRKKSKNKSRAKSSLGISRKKNYTKSAITNVPDTNEEVLDKTSDTNVQNISHNTESTLQYPYLKREVFQIGSTFSLIILILLGFAFIV
tara:strand:+ start:1019 stop:1294 length:276 start_codon:yes stop_codon:yes gene_type:complete